MSGFVIPAMHRDDVDDAPLFWSNEDGWCDLLSATVFTMEEMKTFMLPMGAWGWIQLPENEED